MPNVYNINQIATPGVVPPGWVLIGRSTRWGNPFKIGRDGTRDEVIAKFEVYLAGRPDLIAAARHALRGKDLVCFCAPARCHGEVWLKIANEDIQNGCDD